MLHFWYHFAIIIYITTIPRPSRNSLTLAKTKTNPNPKEKEDKSSEQPEAIDQEDAREGNRNLLFGQGFPR